MDILDNFFIDNSIENLRKRSLNQSEENVDSCIYNLNVANLGSMNKAFSRVSFLGNEVFFESPFHSYRLRDKCIDEINSLFQKENPESKEFSLSISYGSSTISNLIAMNLRIFFDKKFKLVCSKDEHPGGIDPFKSYATVHEVDLDTETIIRKIKIVKPEVVFLSHYSYKNGVSINLKRFYEEISKLANKPIIILDCAQSLGCENLPFKYADIIFASSHKWLCGPKGLGLIWIKKNNEKMFISLGGDKGLNASKMSIPGGCDFLSFYELFCALKLYFEDKHANLTRSKSYLQEKLSEIFQVIPSKHKSMLILTHDDSLLPYYLDLLDKGVSVKYFKEENLFRLSPPYFYQKNNLDKVIQIMKLTMNKGFS